MRMKKVILALAMILVVGQTSMTVMAHGHGGGHHGYGSYGSSYRSNNYQSSNQSGYQGNPGGAAVPYTYSMCGVEGCNIMGMHDHNGAYYYGHYYGDGHDYHAVCNVQGCTVTGAHNHNGVTCMPHSAWDGHGYHNGGYGYHY